jgi:hypothetical protein
MRTVRTRTQTTQNGTCEFEIYEPEMNLPQCTIRVQASGMRRLLYTVRHTDNPHRCHVTARLGGVRTATLRLTVVVESTQAPAARRRSCGCAGKR